MPQGVTLSQKRNIEDEQYVCYPTIDANVSNKEVILCQTPSYIATQSGIFQDMYPELIKIPFDDIPDNYICERFGESLICGIFPHSSAVVNGTIRSEILTGTYAPFN